MYAPALGGWEPLSDKVPSHAAVLALVRPRLHDRAWAKADVNIVPEADMVSL